MALSSDPKTPILLAVLAGLFGYVAYTGNLIDTMGMQGLQARQVRVTALQDSVSKLDAQIDSAKKELALGTAEDLRQRLEGYRASLALMRRLVPERSEVPNLLDDISTRARIRGVNLSHVIPMPEEPGPAPFNTNRYQMHVIGHYDQVGEFLADVASLQRIIVPYALNISAANTTAAKALGDTTGALLEAKFEVRTYVKSAQADEEVASGT